MPSTQKLTKDSELLANIRKKLPDLEAKLRELSSHWQYEDPIYRFYHHSFKVYHLQQQTRELIDLLSSIAPEDCHFCDEFTQITSAGAGDKQFAFSHNRDWTTHTRPMVEAFFHARFFLEMAVKYGNEFKEPPEILPSGWATLLCLYNLR